MKRIIQALIIICMGFFAIIISGQKKSDVVENTVRYCQSDTNCSFNGIKLYGRVQIVESFPVFIINLQGLHNSYIWFIYTLNNNDGIWILICTTQIKENDNCFC